jgi:hypothetical protein
VAEMFAAGPRVEDLVVEEEECNQEVHDAAASNLLENFVGNRTGSGRNIVDLAGGMWVYSVLDVDMRQDRSLLEVEMEAFVPYRKSPLSAVAAECRMTQVADWCKMGMSFALGGVVVTQVIDTVQ